MSVGRVNTKINTARKDSVVTGDEAKKIIRAAEKTTTGKADTVSNSEAKKIGEFFESARSTGGRPPPGATWNPPPISPNRPGMDQEARKEFNNFFIRHKLPYGENEAAIKGEIMNHLEVIDRGEPLPRAPSTKALHEVAISDNRMADGEKLDAFYDAKKKQFFLRSTITTRMDGGGESKKWFGPFHMARIAINPPHF